MDAVDVAELERSEYTQKESELKRGRSRSLDPIEKVGPANKS